MKQKSTQEVLLGPGSFMDVRPCCRYAKTDAASLAYLRRELLRPHYTAMEVGVGVTVAASVVGGTSNTLSGLAEPPLFCSCTLNACNARDLKT